MTGGGWGRNAVKRKKPCRSCGTANPLDFARPTPHRGLCDDCSRDRQKEYERQRQAHERNLAIRRGRDPLAPRKGEKSTYQLLTDPNDSWPPRSTMSHTDFHLSLRTAVLPPGSVWLVRNPDGSKEKVTVVGSNGPPDFCRIRDVCPQVIAPVEAKP